METIALPKPRSYSEALQVAQNITSAALFVIDQELPAAAAQILFRDILQGMYVETTEATLDEATAVWRTSNVEDVQNRN